MFQKSFPIVFALILTTVISGCASTKTKDSCEQFSKDNMFFSEKAFDRNENTSIVKVETAKKNRIL
ncbi:hypothetical protein LBMAG43_19620 [Methylococcaceae bacterium]|nr:hypothetical protein LBMAG43_19620 [Methylococcaceae bacterium]